MLLCGESNISRVRILGWEKAVETEFSQRQIEIAPGHRDRVGTCWKNQRLARTYLQRTYALPLICAVKSFPRKLACIHTSPGSLLTALQQSASGMQAVPSTTVLYCNICFIPAMNSDLSIGFEKYPSGGGICLRVLRNFFNPSGSTP